MIRIEVDVDDAATRELWAALADLAGRLPGEWVLIGGLMVQLHALEAGIRDVRVTRDIDLLGQSRPQRTLGAIERALREEGFDPLGPDADSYAYRYGRGGLVVDVLAPDGMRPPARIGEFNAVGVPGGSQALARAETVTVVVGETEFELRRPSLLGAILIKSRSLLKHADPESQREDLLRLLALVEDPRRTAEDLMPSERRWLVAAEDALAFDATSTLDPQIVRRARQAWRLLIGARSDRGALRGAN